MNLRKHAMEIIVFFKVSYHKQNNERKVLALD